MKFTPALARYYLARNRCARPLSDKRVSKLAGAMRDGTFNADVTFIDIDTTDHMVGGQHVLSAIADTGMTFDLQVRKPEVNDVK